MSDMKSYLVGGLRQRSPRVYYVGGHSRKVLDPQSKVDCASLLLEPPNKELQSINDERLVLL